jgi:hypothetical protein
MSSALEKWVLAVQAVGVALLYVGAEVGMYYYLGTLFRG